MRSVSTILILLLVMILPMAGVQKQHCTGPGTFPSASETCCTDLAAHPRECSESSGRCTNTRCLVSVKILPDAIEANFPKSPPTSAIKGKTPLQKSLRENAANARLPLSTGDRAPPPHIPLFLLHRSLLI